MTGRRNVTGRWGATAAVAVVVALGVHLLRGGVLPSGCVALLVVVGCAVLTTALASCAARRMRTPALVVAALALGQLAMEVVLALPDDVAVVSVAAAAAHVAAGTLLAGLLLGVDRAAESVREVVDRVFPRWRRVHVAVRGHRGVRPMVEILVPVGTPLVVGRPLRGPPTPVRA